MPPPEILDDLLAYSLAFSYGFFPVSGYKYEYAYLDDHLAWFCLAYRKWDTNILIKVDYWAVDIG